MQFIQAIFIIGLCFIHASSAELSCTGVVSEQKLSDMAEECIKKMRSQVKVELDASLSYLAMGSYFSKDEVNRPGFAEMFFESAKEEREHAIKIISYLLMRGELTTNMAELIKNVRPDESWITEKESGLNALKHALKLEKQVTESIRSIIVTCEKAGEPEGAQNDYHLVDYLTADFLDEQYKGQREIAGRIETLHKMNVTHGYELGEFLYDKKLLNGAPL